MNRAIARDALVYGVLPGAATVAALVLAGRTQVVSAGVAAVLFVSLHVTGPAVLFLAWSTRDRKVEYAEGAYPSNQAETGDLDDPGALGRVGGSPWKRRGFLYAAATLAFSLAALVWQLAL